MEEKGNQVAKKEERGLDRYAIWLLLAFLIAAGALFLWQGSGATVENGVSLLAQTFFDTVSPHALRPLAEIPLTPRGPGGDLRDSSSSSRVDGQAGSSPEPAFQNKNPKAPKIISAAAPAPSTLPAVLCVPTSTENLSRRVIFNEIAWMGSPAQAGEGASSASNREWLELKNNSGAAIPLTGWQLLNASRKIKILFGAGEIVPAHGLYLLERTDDEAVPEVTADKIYSGALTNSGDHLYLFDSHCDLVDEVDASSRWPGGSNTTKQTLERNLNDFNWHTSAAPGGTPRKENSSPVMPTASTTSSP